MCVKGQRDQVFRSYDRIRYSKDEEGESSESSRLASIKECERCTEVLRVGKLL